MHVLVRDGMSPSAAKTKYINEMHSKAAFMRFDSIEVSDHFRVPIHKNHNSLFFVSSWQLPFLLVKNILTIHPQRIPYSTSSSSVSRSYCLFCTIAHVLPRQNTNFLPVLWIWIQRIRMFWATRTRIRHFSVRIWSLPSTSKKVRKTLISNILWLLFDFLSMKKKLMYIYLQKY